MPRLGLMSASVLCLFLAPLGLSAPPAGSAAAKNPPRQSGAFHVNFFGEGGGDLPAMDPGQSGYYNEASRRTGEENARAYPDGRTGPIHPLPGMDEPAAGRAGRETFAGPEAAPNFHGDLEAAGPDRRFEPRGEGDVRRIPRRWPGPRRDQQQAQKAGADRAASGDAVETDDLRDAPAAARHYSLWQNLSTPLLLPASKTGGVSLDEARSLGRKDYESHILASRAPEKDAVETKIGMMDGGLDISRESGEKREGLPVTIEIDREKAGDLRDALAGLSSRTGFKMDERFIPSYVGAGKKKVEVRGWVAPERMGEMMASAEVSRVEVDRVAAKPETTLRSAETEILVGIRIPPESSPTEALRDASARLGEKAGFVLDRAIGYQRIPQTSKMVLILAGKVPVRNLSRVMADEAVVKVAPAPKKDQIHAPLPQAEPAVRLTRNPVVWVLLPMLAILLSAQVLLRKKSAQ